MELWTACSVTSLPLPSQTPEPAGSPPTAPSPLRCPLPRLGLPLTNSGFCFHHGVSSPSPTAAHKLKGHREDSAEEGPRSELAGAQLATATRESEPPPPPSPPYPALGSKQRPGGTGLCGERCWAGALTRTQPFLTRRKNHHPGDFAQGVRFFFFSKIIISLSVEKGRRCLKRGRSESKEEGGGNPVP